MQSKSGGIKSFFQSQSKNQTVKCSNRIEDNEMKLQILQPSKLLEKPVFPLFSGNKRRKHDEVIEIKDENEILNEGVIVVDLVSTSDDCNKYCQSNQRRMSNRIQANNAKNVEIEDIPVIVIKDDRKRKCDKKSREVAEPNPFFLSKVRLNDIY